MIQNLSYGDDSDGNVQTITDNLNGARSRGFTGVYPPAALSADRGDDLNRLETASGLYGAQSYGTYDGVGNRQSVTLAGVGYTYTISPTSNQIVSIATSGGTRNFFHQPQGQLTTDQRAPTSEYEFGYNYSGRLASASRNHSLLASYTYNGFEERTIKAAATTTDFIYDRAGHLLAEANAATGAMIREYIWMDDTPVAMVDDTGTNPVVYDIHSDHLGRPQKLTTQSAGLAWDGVFDPFGNVTSVSGSATMLLMFPGQYYDSETQLSQNWNRDYDPTIGRYVESDPIGLASGVNTYVYVRGNPERRRDPTGLDDCAKTKKCRGFARVLQGNANTIGNAGGWSGDSSGNVDVAADTAAVVTSQWGGKGTLRPYIGSISGTSNGVPLFNGISDIVGGGSSIPGVSAAERLMSLNPGDLIIELPSGSQDMGVVPIDLTIPVDLPCPAGTTEDN